MIHVRIKFRLLLKKLPFDWKLLGRENRKNLVTGNRNDNARLVESRKLTRVSTYSKMTYNYLNANGNINSETNSDPNKEKSWKKKIS